MKNFKNRVLSVLLFAFSILIVHDYMVVDTNTIYETSYTNSKKTVVDSTSKIHTQIHMTMDVPRTEINTRLLNSNKEKFFDNQETPTSHLSPVLQRPPAA